MKFTMMHVWLAGASLMLAGCMSVDRTYGTSPDMQIADLEALPTPQARPYYRLGPQEVVEISVVGAESLSGTFLTDDAGDLDYPLLGKVAVAGLAPNEAAQIIADGLRGTYLLDPQVRIIPQSLPVSSISIGGQVIKPGAYPAQGRLTLLRAVNLAGGLGEYAKHDDVLIMRTVDGQNYIGLYNLGAIQRGNYPDPDVYPDDIVMVGDSPGRRRLDSIIAIGTPLLSSTAVFFNQVLR